MSALINFGCQAKIRPSIGLILQIFYWLFLCNSKLCVLLILNHLGKVWFEKQIYISVLNINKSYGTDF